MPSRQIRVGGLLSYVQQFLSILVGLFYTPVMIRLLGQSEYGLYSAVASAVSMLGVLQLGLGGGYIRFYTQYRASGRDTASLAGLYLAALCVIGGVALGCGLVLSRQLHWIFRDGLSPQELEKARLLTVLLATQLAVSFPMTLFSGMIHAQEKFIFAKLVGIFRTLLSPLLTLPLLLMGRGSVALVAVSLGVTLAADILQLWYVFGILKQKVVFGKPDRQVLGEILSYTAFLAMHLAADRINWNVDKVLLGRYRDTSSVAVYAVASALYDHYLTLGLPIATLFIPRVHKIAAKDPGHRSLTAIFVRVGRMQYILLLAVLSGFILFGRDFLRLWVGQGYDDAYWVALLLMLPGTVDIIQNIAIEIQRSQGHHRFRAVMSLAMAGLNVVISVPLCRRFGPIGCALGTAGSVLFVQGFVMNRHYKRSCGLDTGAFWKNILHIGRSGLLSLALGFGIKALIPAGSWWLLFLSIALYCLIYGASMWYFCLKKEEKAMLRRRIAGDKEKEVWEETIV